MGEIICGPAEKYKENYEAMWDVLHSNGYLRFEYGVEVGVRHGFFSHYLLSHDPDLRMILVDPYLPYVDLGEEMTAEKQKLHLEQAYAYLTPYHDRIKFEYTPSVTAAHKHWADYFDFVFIDAEHTYEACKSDINAWWPMIRKGGLLSGHDYNMDGVKQAVTEFARGRKVHHIDAPADVWFMEK